MKSEEKYLRFEVIWRDEDMFELNIQANNGRFLGTTEVYESPDGLLKFANRLKGFPFNNKKLKHFCGKKNGYSYFEMELYKIGSTGICGVLVTLEESVATEYREEEKDRVSLELIVEPNAIDVFQNELKHLAKNEEGIATLIGIYRHTSNVLS